jgi:hypothetical protein
MFAKLTSTKLTSTRTTSNRVSRQMHSGQRPERTLLAAPAHANDNQRVAGAAGRPRLACQWVVSATGALECRWHIVPDGAARPDEPGGAVCAQTPVALGGRSLALVAGFGRVLLRRDSHLS